MKVFISHSNLDKAYANILSKELQEKGISVWDVENTIEVGENLIDKISNLISEADAIIILLSKHSNDSRWVNIETAMSASIENKKIIPIVLDDEANIPSYLQNIQYLDLRNKELNKNIDVIKNAINNETNENSIDTYRFKEAIKNEKKSLENEILIYNKKIMLSNKYYNRSVIFHMVLYVSYALLYLSGYLFSGPVAGENDFFSKQFFVIVLMMFISIIVMLLFKPKKHDLLDDKTNQDGVEK